MSNKEEKTGTRRRTFLDYDSTPSGLRRNPSITTKENQAQTCLVFLLDKTEA